MEPKVSFWSSFTSEGRFDKKWAAALVLTDPQARIAALRGVREAFERRPGDFAARWPSFLGSYLDTRNRAALSVDDLAALASVSETVAAAAPDLSPLADSWLAVAAAHDALGQVDQAASLWVRLHGRDDCPPDARARCATLLAARGLAGDEHVAVYAAYLKDKRPPVAGDGVVALVQRLCAVDFDSDPATLERALAIARRVKPSKVPIAGALVAFGIDALRNYQNPLGARDHFKAALDADRACRAAQRGLVAATVLAGKPAAEALDLLPATICQDDPVVDGLFRLGNAAAWLDGCDEAPPPMKAAELEALQLQPYAGDVFAFLVGRLHLIEGAASAAAAHLLPLAARNPTIIEYAYHAAWAAILTGQPQIVSTLFLALKDHEARWVVGLLLLDSDEKLAKKAGVRGTFGTLTKPVAPVVKARLALIEGENPVPPEWQAGRRSPVEDFEALRTRLAAAIAGGEADVADRALHSGRAARLPKADRLFWQGLALIRTEPGQGRALLEQAVRLGCQRAAFLLAVVDLERGRPAEACNWLDAVPERGHRRAALLRAHADALAGREDAAVERLERLCNKKGEGAAAWQLLSQLYLRRVGAAERAGESERARLYREQAAGALARAREAGATRSGSEADILFECVAFAQDPSAAAACARTWPVLQRLPRARRRAWVSWHAAAAYLAESCDGDAVSAAEELVTLLEEAQGPAESAVDAVAGLVARAAIGAGTQAIANDLSALLRRMLAHWPRPGVTRALQLAVASSARRQMDGCSAPDGKHDGKHVAENLSRLAAAEAGNVPLALLAASQLVAEGQAPQASEMLRRSVRVDDDGAGIANVLAAVIAGGPSDQSVTPAADASVAAVPGPAGQLLRAAAAIVEGRNDVACEATLSALRDPDAAGVVKLERCLPGLAAHAARAGLDPGSLGDVVRQMAETAEPPALAALARYAAALGDTTTAEELWEKALAGDPDPESPAHAEYDAYLAYTAVKAYRAGDLPGTIRRLRRPTVLQQGQETAREADFEHLVQEARAAEADGRWAAARAAYGRALRRRPGDATVTRALKTRVVDAGAEDCYPTIEAAIEAADPDDRILVARGTYAEGLVLDKPLEIAGQGVLGEVIIETSGADCILVQAERGRVANLVLRQKGGAGGTWYGIDVEEGEIEIADCDITSEAAAGIGIHSDAHPRVLRNRIHDSGGNGVLIYDGAGGEIEENDVFGNRMAGIAVTTKAAPAIRRNRIHDGKASGIAMDAQAAGLIEDNEIWANETGVQVLNGATPAVTANRVHHNRTEGLVVTDQGAGKFERNDVFANVRSGIAIGKGATPECRNNLVRDGETAGVLFYDEGLGVLEANDIHDNKTSNVAVQGRSRPEIRGNRIHGSARAGILVLAEAGGVIENNDVYGNAGAGVQIAGRSDPVVRHNRVHDGGSAGILVTEDSRGTLEDNDVAANAASGIEVVGGSNPVIRGNRIVGGLSCGMLIAGEATGTIEDNEIAGNKAVGMQVSKKANPTVRRNRFHEGQAGAIFVTDAGAGVFEENEVWANANAAFSIAEESDPTVRNNNLHDGKGGALFVYARGRGTFENNTMTKNETATVEVREGGDPVLRHNTIVEGLSGGVFIYKDGRGTFEDNDICGHKLTGVEVREGGNPVVRNNRIKDNGGHGIWVHTGGGGLFERNKLSGNSAASINVAPECAGRVTLNANW